MVHVKNALIVGGGIGGMSAAVRLRQAGVAVELVEIDPAWRVYGAGITITGPTLRAFRTLGILDEVREQGAFIERIRLIRYDGVPVGEVQLPPLEAGLPISGAIMRPILHRILSQRTLASGAAVRLGISVAGLRQEADGVEVDFDDGSSGRYDLVIGADGLNSRIRTLVMPDAPKPTFTGQGCWRVLAPRPHDLVSGEFYVGLPVRAGINPCSATQVYLFVLTRMEPNSFVRPEDQIGMLREFLAPFGGHVGDIRDSLGEESSLVYRPLDALLLDLPWHVGRVVLLGDAVHATTPHLASGAGMAVEDAVVLAEELERGDDVATALARFENRRWERCRLVVQNSVRLGQMEMAGEDPHAHARLFEATTKALAQPI